jgi:hypothetical protein
MRNDKGRIGMKGMRWQILHTRNDEPEGLEERKGCGKREGRWSNSMEPIARLPAAKSGWGWSNSMEPEQRLPAAKSGLSGCGLQVLSLKYCQGLDLLGQQRGLGLRVLPCAPTDHLCPDFRRRHKAYSKMRTKSPPERDTRRKD